MNEIYERLLGQLELPMLKQGDAPKSVLLEEFRLTPHAVLFGTSSFWQGVDVQGEQLSCVIIDRLPFAVPSDPVVAARVRAIDAGGGNAFFEYRVPSAVITLKQGFGRLIRSLHDRLAGFCSTTGFEEAIRARVCGESAAPQSYNGLEKGRGVLQGGFVGDACVVAALPRWNGQSPVTTRAETKLFCCRFFVDDDLQVRGHVLAA
jgi:hypothetical protein